MNGVSVLFEIGCEELPTFSLQPLGQQLLQQIKDGFHAQHLDVGECQWFASPRRLAVLLKDCAPRQADYQVEKRGPALVHAYDSEGQATKAATGFAKSCGVSLAELDTLKTDQGEWLYFSKNETGAPLAQLLPDIITTAVKKLVVSKPMFWGDASGPFARPVQWLVLLLNDEIIPVQLFDQQSSNITYGHRFLSPEPITLLSPDDYEAELEHAKVYPGFNKRRAIILEQLLQLEKDLDSKIEFDDELVKEVTGLVEWPISDCANFSPDFLSVPAEALISSMRAHQKTFPVFAKDGALKPCFIYVSNIISQQPEAVRKGNETVMHARLSDAAFFFAQDKKISLRERQQDLQHISFQKGLGSLFDKSERIAKLSVIIGQQLQLDQDTLLEASLLCKCDLASQMVGEFPELQGIMGYYYALNDGLSDSTALAIKHHYQPAFAGDELPQSLSAATIALADRLDSMAGIFALGKIPSGDKDPFALRRAAYGILRILIEKELPLDIEYLLTMALSAYDLEINGHDVLQQLLRFFAERLRAWYGEKGIATNLVKAVLARQHTELLDFDLRIKALTYFIQQPESEALAAACKRVYNILLKQDVSLSDAQAIQQNLLQEPAEISLVERLHSMTSSLNNLFAQKDYQQVLNTLADFKLAIDAFFEEVMVMVDDQALQKNRLSILQHLYQRLTQVADISLLQGS